MEHPCVLAAFPMANCRSEEEATVLHVKHGFPHQQPYLFSLLFSDLSPALLTTYRPEGLKLICSNASDAETNCSVLPSNKVSLSKPKESIANSTQGYYWPPWTIPVPSLGCQYYPHWETLNYELDT